MKKFAIAGLISILATLALSGCTAETADTEEVVVDEAPAVQEEVVMEDVAPEAEESGMLTFADDDFPVTFEYPSSLEVDIPFEGACEDGSCVIRLGDEYNDNGYLRDMVRIAIETEEYEEMMAAETVGMPYMPYVFNLCENTPSNSDLIRECATENGVTSYFARLNRGDLIYTKNYYIDTDSEEWTNVQVEANLFVDDYKLMSEDEAEPINLDAEQLRRIEIAEGIVESLIVVGINTRGGGGMADGPEDYPAAPGL